MQSLQITIEPPDQTEPGHAPLCAPLDDPPQAPATLSSGDLLVRLAEESREADNGWKLVEEMTELAQSNAAQLAGAQTHVHKLAVQLELARESAAEWQTTARGAERISEERRVRLDRLSEAVEGLTSSLAEQTATYTAELDQIQARWQKTEDQRFAAVEQCVALESLLAQADRAKGAAEHQVELFKQGEQTFCCRAEHLKRVFLRGIRIAGNRIGRLEADLAKAETSYTELENQHWKATVAGRDAIEALAIENFDEPTLSLQIKVVEEHLLGGFGDDLRARFGEVPASHWLSTRAFDLESTLASYQQAEHEALRSGPHEQGEQIELSQAESCQRCGHERKEWEGFIRGNDDVWRCGPCDAHNRSQDLAERLSTPPCSRWAPPMLGADTPSLAEPECAACTKNDGDFCGTVDCVHGDKFEPEEPSPELYCAVVLSSTWLNPETHKPENERLVCELPFGHTDRHQAHGARGKMAYWEPQHDEGREEPSPVCADCGMVGTREGEQFVKSQVDGRALCLPCRNAEVDDLEDGVGPKEEPSPDCLRRLTVEELAEVEPLTEETVSRALELGRKEAESFLAQCGPDQQATDEQTSWLNQCTSELAYAEPDLVCGRCHNDTRPASRQTGLCVACAEAECKCEHCGETIDRGNLICPVCREVQPLKADWQLAFEQHAKLYEPKPTDPEMAFLLDEPEPVKLTDQEIDQPKPCSSEHPRALDKMGRVLSRHPRRKTLKSSSRMHLESGGAEGRT